MPAAPRATAATLRKSTGRDEAGKRRSRCNAAPGMALPPSRRCCRRKCRRSSCRSRLLMATCATQPAEEIIVNASPATSGGACRRSARRRPGYSWIVRDQPLELAGAPKTRVIELEPAPPGRSVCTRRPSIEPMPSVVQVTLRGWSWPWRRRSPAAIGCSHAAAAR